MFKWGGMENVTSIQDNAIDHNIQWFLFSLLQASVYAGNK